MQSWCLHYSGFECVRTDLFHQWIKVSYFVSFQSSSIFIIYVFVFFFLRLSPSQSFIHFRRLFVSLGFLSFTHLSPFFSVFLLHCLFICLSASMCLDFRFESVCLSISSSLSLSVYSVYLVYSVFYLLKSSYVFSLSHCFFFHLCLSAAIYRFYLFVSVSRSVSSSLSVRLFCQSYQLLSLLSGV